jgi:glutamate-5-semialdehyde dehydrogenase
MESYQKVFSDLGMTVGQVLLTDDDLSSSERSANIKNTLNTLLQLDVIPIINQNDTTSFTEILFGDNDKLSALVACLMGANHLVLASSVKGFCKTDTNGQLTQEVVGVVSEINDETFSHTTSDTSGMGRGGMVSKLQAAQLATNNKIDCYVVHGESHAVLDEIFEKKSITGTHFLAKKKNAVVQATEMPDELSQIFQNLRRAQKQLLGLDDQTIRNCLLQVAKKLESSDVQEKILKINASEVSREQSKVTPAFLDRMRLDQKRIFAMAKQLKEIAEQKNAKQSTVQQKLVRDDGLLIEKQTVPLGCVAMIFESRPNVLAEAFALCFKSRNSVFLRSGSESFQTCKELLAVIHQVLKENQIDRNIICLPPSEDRKYVLPTLHATQFIDLVVARGGDSLIKFVTANSKIPVIKHDKGICHLYVDESANLEMALKLLINGKVQRPSACNALESLLVHKSISSKFIPIALKALHENKVECRVDDVLYSAYSKDHSFLVKAKPADWDTEYLDLIISIKQVDNLEQAMDHIEAHGSRHSDVICTQDVLSAQRFLAEVDSAAVYHNASTRFTDGYEFGLGAEMGISNQKLHVRGPMGMNDLHTWKWIVRGNGHVRT